MCEALPVAGDGRTRCRQARSPPLRPPSPGRFPPPPLPVDCDGTMPPLPRPSAASTSSFSLWPARAQPGHASHRARGWAGQPRRRATTSVRLRAAACSTPLCCRSLYVCFARVASRVRMSNGPEKPSRTMKMLFDQRNAILWSNGPETPSRTMKDRSSLSAFFGQTAPRSRAGLKCAEVGGASGPRASTAGGGLLRV